MLNDTNKECDGHKGQKHPEPNFRIKKQFGHFTQYLIKKKRRKDDQT